MATKIVEVLARILDGLNKNSTLEEVNLSLIKNKEFDQQTVGVAFSLVYDKVLSNKLNPKKRKRDSNNFRILTEEEKEALGIDNYNYLMHLNNVGLISSVDVETILEQVGLFPENTVTKEDINAASIFA